MRKFATEEEGTPNDKPSVRFDSSADESRREKSKRSKSQGRNKQKDRELEIIFEDVKIDDGEEFYHDRVITYKQRMSNEGMPFLTPNQPENLKKSAFTPVCPRRKTTLTRKDVQRMVYDDIQKKEIKTEARVPESLNE